MAVNIYYKIDGDNLYYTNENKTGYTLLPWNTVSVIGSNGKNIIIELWGGKFRLREDSENLFFHALNTTFNDMDKWDTSSVTSMHCLFQGCKNLTSIDLSNFNTSNVTNMERMFSSCESLQSIDVSSFNTSNVTTMCSMFYGCYSLKSLDLSNFDTSNVTNFSFIFTNCRSIETLDLSNFVMTNATTICSMFQNCYAMKSVNLYNFIPTEKLTTLDLLFLECGSLEHIYTRPNTDWDLLLDPEMEFENIFQGTYNLHNYDKYGIYRGKQVRRVLNNLGTGYFEGGKEFNYKEYTIYEKNNDNWNKTNAYLKDLDTWNTVEVYI